MITIKKLPDGTYEIEETMPVTKQKSIVDKVVLEQTISQEEQEIVGKQAKLDKHKELLTKINEVK